MVGRIAPRAPHSKPRSQNGAHGVSRPTLSVRFKGSSREFVLRVRSIRCIDATQNGSECLRALSWKGGSCRAATTPPAFSGRFRPIRGCENQASFPNFRAVSSLPHDIPLWVDPNKETYFITINTRPRGRNQLALPHVAEPLFDTVRHWQKRFLWWPYLFLLMPDYLHALFSFPPSDKPIKLVVSKWKEWTAKQLGIDWQKGFFEHRLRSEESRRQKADYILANPVRAGLVARAADWSHVYFGDGQLPEFPD
jgi:putative transposase